MSELDKLEQYLKDHGYFYEREDKEDRYGYGVEKALVEYGHKFDLHTIIVYECDISEMSEETKEEYRCWDVICHWGSYGYEDGLLEGMGDIFNGGIDVEGWLTAQDVIDRLEGKV